MGGAGDGIFVYAGGGGKEAGDEIVLGVVGAGGDDDASDGDFGEGAEIGMQGAEGFFVGDFYQIVHAVALFGDVLMGDLAGDVQGGEEIGRGVVGGDGGVRRGNPFRSSRLVWCR